MFTPTAPTTFSHNQTAAVSAALAVLAAGSVGLVYGDHGTALVSVLVGLVVASTAIATAIFAANLACTHLTHHPISKPDLTAINVHLSQLDDGITVQKVRGDRLEGVIIATGKDVVSVRAEVHAVLGYSRTSLETLRGVLFRVSKGDVEGSGPHRIYSEN